MWDELYDDYQIADGTWSYNCRDCRKEWKAKDMEDNCTSCGSTNIGGVFDEK